jgi:hypothetical protein
MSNRLSNLLNRFLPSFSEENTQNLDQEISNLIREFSTPTPIRRPTPTTFPTIPNIRNRTRPVSSRNNNLRDSDLLFYICREYLEVTRLYIQNPSLHSELTNYNRNMASIIYLLKEIFQHETRTQTQQSETQQRREETQETRPVPLERTEVFSFTIPLTTTSSSTPLTPEEIQRYVETITYDPSLNEPRCPISLENFTIGENISKITTCGHIFKTHEIMRWLQRNRDCPICKRQITGEEPRQRPETDLSFNSDIFTNILQNLFNANIESFEFNLDSGQGTHGSPNPSFSGN